MPSSDILKLINQLLPGFVAAWIFYALTAHPRKDMFERTVQALIFTGIVRCFVLIAKFAALGIGRVWSLGEWSDDEGGYVLSMIVGIFVGFIFTYFANTSRFHDFLTDDLPKKKIPWLNWSCPQITKRTSYPSEWFSTFANRERFICLHLKGDKENRRLIGWPSEFPDTPGVGHFVLTHAEWLLPDNQRVSIWPSEIILISAAEIEMVEILDETFTPIEIDKQNQSEAIRPLLDLHRQEASHQPSNTENGEAVANVV